MADCCHKNIRETDFWSSTLSNQMFSSLLVPYSENSLKLESIFSAKYLENDNESAEAIMVLKKLESVRCDNMPFYILANVFHKNRKKIIFFIFDLPLASPRKNSQDMIKYD